MARCVLCSCEIELPAHQGSEEMDRIARRQIIAAKKLPPIPIMETVMKAMIYERYGDADVLQLSDQPMPKVAPGEVLVRTRCASVNPVDWKIMAGYLDGLMQVYFPVTPGWDVAGIVEAVGLDVPEFNVGD